MQKNAKPKQKELDEIKFREDLVKEINEDFSLRQKNRLELEKQWQKNMDFLAGKQYEDLNYGGVSFSASGDFSWNERGVYNHVAPIIESRLARLSRLKIELSVMAKSDDDTDVKGAESAEKAIKAIFNKESTTDAIKKTNLWSET